MRNYRGAVQIETYWGDIKAQGGNNAISERTHLSGFVTGFFPLKREIALPPKGIHF